MYFIVKCVIYLIAHHNVFILLWGGGGALAKVKSSKNEQRREQTKQLGYGVPYKTNRVLLHCSDKL